MVDIIICRCQMNAEKEKPEIRELINTIKSHLMRGDRATEKAEKHYKIAGMYLKELKAKKPSGEPWYKYVERVFGRSREQADLYIRLADGKTTVEEVHASQKKRDAKRRPPKPGVAHTGSSEPDDDNTIDFNKFKRVDGKVKSACDFNPEDPDDVAEKNDSAETIRHRIFMHHAAEARRHGLQNGLDKAAKREITDEIILAAQQAADVWTELANELRRRTNKRA